jgi:uncharacterized protein with ATP-grasp and redox domains
MRQSLEAARFASSDTELHEKVVRNVMEMVLQRGFRIPPPIIGQEIHRVIRKMVNKDPYAQVKRQFNDLLLSQMDALRKKITASETPFETAVRIAIAGNMIDCALRANLQPSLVDEAVAAALQEPIVGDLAGFQKWVEKSDKILYLLDNCGEIVCDRLLIEQMFPKKVTAAVRGMPVLNDATLEDAKYVGLTEIVPVISNGNDAIGTILEQCSEEFTEHFYSADLIISKGLGNYETLITAPPEKTTRPIAFLFKAKCAFIAQFSGTKLGDTVIFLKNV